MARGSLTRRLLVAGAVVWVARWAVAQGETKPAPIDVPEDLPEAAIAPATPRRAFRKRFATSLVFSALFFAGAAFTAGAGNQLAQVDDLSTAAPTVVDAATVPAAVDATPVEAAPVEAAPAPADSAPADPSADAVPLHASSAPVAPAAAAPASTPAPAAQSSRPTAVAVP